MTDIPFPLSAFRKITDICISMLCDSCSANRESIKYTLPFENHVVTQCPRSRSYNIWIAVKKSEHINQYLVIPQYLPSPLPSTEENPWAVPTCSRRVDEAHEVYQYLDCCQKIRAYKSIFSYPSVFTFTSSINWRKSLGCTNLFQES